MLLLSSLPQVAPTNDLGESMLLLSFLPQVAPANDLGESVLLLSSPVAPSSDRSESWRCQYFPSCNLCGWCELGGFAAGPVASDASSLSPVAADFFSWPVAVA